MDGIRLNRFQVKRPFLAALLQTGSLLEKEELQPTGRIAKKLNKMEQLSGVMIIIIIGGGVLTFVMLFIFAKRQIMRFTLRSRRGPHVPLGNDAKKAYRKEIERRLDCIQKITQEPKLLWTDDKYILQPDRPLPPYYYRMQAVDDVKILETEIAKNDGSIRHSYDSLRAFLLTTLSAVLNGNGQRMIHQFCDMYEHARHDPNEFGNDEYEAYHRLLLKLVEAATQLKIYNSRKSSPARTPKKSNKLSSSLLDPSRLKPPQTNTLKATPTAGLGKTITHQTVSSHQSKVNLTLGLLHGGCDMTDASPLRLPSLGITTAIAKTAAPTVEQRDIVIRNRMKAPNLRDITYNANDDKDHEQDDEIISICSVPFKHNNASLV